MHQSLDEALDALRPLLSDRDGLVRAIAAGRRRGAAAPARAELRPIDLKGTRHLQVVRADPAGPRTSNLSYDGPAAAAVESLLAQPYANWHVETTSETVQLRVTKKGEALVHRAATSLAPRLPERRHDRQSDHLLDPGDPLFDVIGGGADKRRQVDAFLRALDPVLGIVRERRPLRVVDLGCGNAYLTFAAYRHLHGTHGLPVELTGIDLRPLARERNTRLADVLGWSEHVRFVEGTNVAAPLEGADIVLALHACDTATDEALARAVRWAAPVVLAAPCCHHDLQVQLRTGGTPTPYGLISRLPTLRERLADTLTDAIRATLLRLCGYRVEVLEFVDSRHTPRNVLLRAVHTGAAPDPKDIADYRALTAGWGLRPALETLLAAELGPVLAS